MQEIGLAKDAIYTLHTSPAARNRYIYYPDHIVRMPHPTYGVADNLWSLMTEPVFKGLIWRGLTEMWKPPRDPALQDESVGEFFSRRIGENAVDRILSAIIHGIYAGDVWQLSAKSLFPVQWRDEVRAGSVTLGMLRRRSDGLEMSKREADFLRDMKNFAWDPALRGTLERTSVFTFREGLSMLTDKLAVSLFETGQVEFKTNSPVQSINLVEGNTGVQVCTTSSDEPRTHTHVVSTLSPDHLNQVTRLEDSSNTTLIPSIPTVTVMTVNLYFRTPGLHEPGFGYLIPRGTPFENNPERALGVVFDTAYSPSPDILNESNWRAIPEDKLKELREEGTFITLSDFAYYNLPDKPNAQDDVKARGTKVTVMLGGHWWNGWPTFPDDDEGLSLACSVLERHLGIKEAPIAWQVNLEKNCIPQYTVGHEQRLRQAHNNIWREYRGRLKVAGNWMSGVGVNDCIRSAYDVAQNFAKDGTGLEHIGDVKTVVFKPVKPGEKSSEED